MIRDDLPMLSRWLEQPHVREWWVDADADPGAVEEKYGPHIEGTDPTEMFVICAMGQPVGLMQRYRIADYPEWAHTLSMIDDATTAAGIDYLIGEPEAVNRGFGTEAIRAFIPAIYDRWHVSAVLVSVQQANRASWRALERAGFTRIWAGILDSDDPSDAGPSFVYRHEPSR